MRRCELRRSHKRFSVPCRSRTSFRIACSFLLVSMGAPLSAQMDAGLSEQIWPVKGEYVSSNRCASCHAERAHTFHANRMSRALEPIEDCEILKSNPRLAWSDGQYRYVIEKEGKGYIYRVTDGTQTAEALLQYAFGVGESQTYV